MSDRLKGCTVVFDRDIRVDDAEALLNAIRMIKGVKIVNPSISTCEDWMVEKRARREITDKLYKWIAEQEKL